MTSPRASSTNAPAGPASARLEREHAELVALARSPCVATGDLPGACRAITEAAARVLDVARASIWFYDPPRTAIRCAALFDAASATHSEGRTLAAADYPAYFRALEDERVIDAGDAHNDPRTAEFSVVYLAPLDIGAMLDAPIRVGGRMVGVICSEHVGGPRPWSVDDQRFASSLADLIALALEESDRRQAEAALEESETRYRQLVEAAPDVIFTIALDGNVTSFNSAFEALSGFPRTEYVGRPFGALIVPDDLPRAADIWARVLRGERTPPVDLRIRTRTRGVVIVQSRVVPILRGGQVTAVLGIARDVTTEQAAREALHQREAHFRALIEHAQDLVMVLTATGAVGYASPSHHAVLGVDPAGMIGREPIDWVHPDDLPLLEETLRRSLTNPGTVLPVTLRARRMPNDWRHLEGTVINLLDHGAVGGVVLNSRDVTERRRAEARLRALTEILKEMGTGFDLADLLLRVERRTTLLLPADGAATLRRREDDGRLTPISHVGLTPAEVAALGDLCNDPGTAVPGMLTAGQLVVIDGRSRPAGGSRALLQACGVEAVGAAPLFRHEEFVGAFVVVRRDAAFDPDELDVLDTVAGKLAGAMTAIELYRAQQEEAETKAALVRVGREIISELATPVLLERVCALTTEIVGCDVSHAFLWDPDRQAFMTVAGHGDWADPMDALRHVPIPRALIAPVLDGIMRDEFVVIDWTSHADTTLGRFLVSRGGTAAMFTALRRRGELVGILSAGYRHRNPGFSDRQQRVMRGLAQTASLGLQNAHLVEELERASRVKDDFVATMSHELRTPLNVIIGYTEMLADRALGPLTPEQQATLGRIGLRSRELLELVQSVLDLSRLESGRQGLDLREVDLEALATQVEGETRPVAVNPDVVYSWEVVPDVGAIVTDAPKLKVVLKNLITNALKFTERGHVTVRVRSSDDGAIIDVVDSGIGIDAEGRRVIFEPFRQVSGSARHNAGGVGLGLHIVRRLLGLLGGEITVDSEVGKGSTFRVSLPAAPG